MAEQLPSHVSQPLDHPWIRNQVAADQFALEQVIAKTATARRITLNRSKQGINRTGPTFQTFDIDYIDDTSGEYALKEALHSTAH